MSLVLFSRFLHSEPRNENSPFLSENIGRLILRFTFPPSLKTKKISGKMEKMKN